MPPPRPPTRALPGLLAVALLAAGCVETTAGLTVIVRIDPEPTAALALPEGALTVERARLAPGAVELVPCETAVAARPAPWGWLIGAAHAHGEATGALVADVAPLDALDGAPREIARIEVPPDLALCAVQLAVGEGTGVGLAGRLDGASRDWLATFESAPRLPIPKTRLDAGHRSVTITLRFALADWVADLPAGDESAQARALAANAAVAIVPVVQSR